MKKKREQQKNPKMKTREKTTKKRKIEKIKNIFNCLN